jgi:hypothetical protein
MSKFVLPPKLFLKRNYLMKVAQEKRKIKILYRARIVHQLNSIGFLCSEVAYKAIVYHATLLLKVSFSLIFTMSIDHRMSIKDFELNHTWRLLGALMNVSYYHSLLARHVCSWTTR